MLSTLSKLFTYVLNQRLYEFLVKNNILKNEQLGFKKKHSTIDGIFTLKALIDRFVKSKPKKSKNMLFSCFVDFKKAFDSIPRQLLFFKVENAGIKNCFLSLLKSMYDDDCSVVKKDGLITEPLNCFKGVKQGCMLSPTLFNLFLSDLPEFLKETNVIDRICVDNAPLNCLLYADDLVLVSKNYTDLQSLLNKLELFSNANGLAVNIEKTKVLIFNNSGRQLCNYTFYFQEKILENVRLYKYLGLTFSAFGNFTVVKQELKKSALKELFKLKKEMGHSFNYDPVLTMKLFDALVKPILLYGSEVWATDTVKDDPIESVHIKFCKILLGVGKSATNSTCYGELGRFPLHVAAKLRCLKYWLSIVSPPKNFKITHLIYQEMIDSSRKICFSQKVKDLLARNGLGYIWVEENNNSCTRQANPFLVIKRRIEDIEKQNWHGELFNDERGNHGQRNKLRTFRLFKFKHEFEGYLVKVKQFKHRRALTKLRISNHDLEIEKGRYSGGYKKVEERKCFHCTNVIEDEKHFLTKCPLYSKLRNDFIRQNNLNDFIAEDHLFLKLINPPSKLQTQAAKYIYDCFALRSQTKI